MSDSDIGRQLVVTFYPLVVSPFNVIKKKLHFTQMGKQD